VSASILPLHVEGLGWDAGGRRLLDDVGFTLESGRRSVLLGPNGAGKSLALRLCHGLLEPARGSVRWARPHAEARLRQAMLFQQPVLLRRSAAANVAYALAVRGVPRAERARRVAEALEFAGLRPLARRPATVLSGGEQQRLALARAWALRPEVLLLDEPTSSLDPGATRAVEAFLDAAHEQGTTLLLTTHDLGQARRLADEVLFLHRGRLVEQAPADRFFESPASQEAQAFVAGELPW